MALIFFYRIFLRDIFVNFYQHFFGNFMNKQVNLIKGSTDITDVTGDSKVLNEGKRFASKFITLQAKGGVGKSFFCKLALMHAIDDDTNKKYLFLDCDDASSSLQNFCKRILKRRGIDKIKNIDVDSFSIFSSVGDVGGIDNNRIKHLFEYVKVRETLYDYIFLDFGGMLSLLYANYVANQIKDIDKLIRLYKENKFFPVLLFCGGESQNSCKDFFMKLDKVSRSYMIPIYNKFQDTKQFNFDKLNKQFKGQVDFLQMPSMDDFAKEKELHEKYIELFEQGYSFSEIHKELNFPDLNSTDAHDQLMIDLTYGKIYNFANSVKELFTTIKSSELGQYINKDK